MRTVDYYENEFWKYWDNQSSWFNSWHTDPQKFMVYLLVEQYLYDGFADTALIMNSYQSIRETRHALNA